MVSLAHNVSENKKVEKPYNAADARHFLTTPILGKGCPWIRGRR